MELKDLVGRWRKLDKGATSYTITTCIFSTNGTYKKHEKSSGTAGSRYFEEQGNFEITSPLQIEIVPEGHSRSVLSPLSLGTKVA